jgi:hypothetical protein
MRCTFIPTLALLISGASFAEELECDVGPIYIELGGGSWQVTSCSDGRSLVFATMKDNPAMPFIFIVQRSGETEISGEGTGSRDYSSAAFKELETMTEADFDQLVRATKEAAAKK